ncbi:MAG: TerB family tellurite resistance protein [Saprospiraceae bacterium]|nr:TerB family tellurite resistance protein [Saprospiraceae bacterium]
MDLKLTKVQLHDAFGELLYAIAMVDGEIQQEEVVKIEELLADHEAAEAIKWSFKYEVGKQKTVLDAYRKAIDICKHYGKSADYPFLLEMLKDVAEASNGLDENERAMIHQIEIDLAEVL